VGSRKSYIRGYSAGRKGGREIGVRNGGREEGGGAAHHNRQPTDVERPNSAALEEKECGLEMHQIENLFVVESVEGEHFLGPKMRRGSQFEGCQRN
jgi:hypothetical protein